MIVCELRHWKRYGELAELFPAFAFLEKHARAAGLAEGRNEIDGDRLFALLITHEPKSASECRFETHHHYADVVYIAEGTEMIGYAPAEDLTPDTPYDAQKDLAFFTQPELYAPILLRSGMVAIFYPEDGHMPGAIYARTGQVKKIVVKVKVAPIG